MWRIGVLVMVACGGTSSTPPGDNEIPGIDDVRVFELPCTSPGAVWSGDALWIACQASTDDKVHVASVDGDADKLVDVTIGAAVDVFTSPAIAWAGDRIVTAFDQDAAGGRNELVVGSIATDGATTLPVVIPMADSVVSMDADIAWSGSEAGVVFDDNGLFLVRTDANGAQIGTTTIVATSIVARQASIVWTGSDWAIAYRNAAGGTNDAIFIARHDATGAKIGTDVQVTTPVNDVGNPALCWIGNGYALAWEDNRAMPAEEPGRKDLWFAQLDANGARVGAEVQLRAGPGSALQPSIACTANETAIAWLVERDGSKVGVVVAKVDASGTRVTEDVVPTQLGSPDGPRIVHVGDGFALVWEATRSSRHTLVRFL